MTIDKDFNWHRFFVVLIIALSIILLFGFAGIVYVLAEIVLLGVYLVIRWVYLRLRPNSKQANKENTNEGDRKI